MYADQQVVDMERIIGYTFKDRQLAVECLYHGGLPIFFNSMPQKPERNERLAILGDSILNVVLVSKWYRTRNAQGLLLAKVQWTGVIHKDQVTNSSLAIRGREVGLDACVIKDPGTTTVSKNMIATTIEAIIGAVFEDSGANNLDEVRAVMDKLGFFNHDLFLVTYCDFLPLEFSNIQKITDVQYLDPS